MLCLTSFNEAYLSEPQELEVRDEIFSKYKYALAHIGVDFYQEDVQEALLNRIEGFEDAIRATIAYWYWLEKQSRPFYANACIIQAMNEGWDSGYWKDSYLDNPNFKNPCNIFWEEVGKVWGFDVRNKIIADVNSDDKGYEYLMFRNGKTISLLAAKRLGWERLKEYALEEY